MTYETHIGHLSSMSSETLYEVLRLRTDIFVVEQACAYPELDGRDLEPESKQVWVTEGGTVVATLRILRDPEALRIGRVAAHPSVRGLGVAGRMLEFAIEAASTEPASTEPASTGAATTEPAGEDPKLPIVLDAQEPLESWYGRYGFVRDGETFLEDGIAHVPMRRDPVLA
ncbi:GNAT family N-acetyltransferase [Leucobacter chinensis]|uniref:GNAT family N-acetyltransferase n=1 Tax=Leucobacter chinensis TaxID=2851010 RepID=UPI001C21D172|nr:GNAT family N-acetyltransferase [Leucobacter chinensis]